MSLLDWTRSETISEPDRIVLSWTSDPNAQGQTSEKKQLLVSTTKSTSTSIYETISYQDINGNVKTQDVQTKKEDIKWTTQASVNQEYILACLKYGRGLPSGGDQERSVTEYEYKITAEGPILIKDTTEVFISFVSFSAQLQGIPYVVPSANGANMFYVPLSGETISHRTIVTYEQVKTAEGRDLSRTKTSRWIALGLTSEGKGPFQKRMKEVGSLVAMFPEAFPTAIDSEIVSYSTLIFQGTEVQVSTGRVPVPSKPSNADLAASEVVNGSTNYDTGGSGGGDNTQFNNPTPQTSNDRFITGRVIFDGQNYDDGNPTASATYQMPYAPDDYFYYASGTRNLSRSQAEQSAIKFGQTESALDVGHAFGQNIVTSFDRIPTLELSPVYIRLAGLEVAFLTDSLSYAFDANGMVVSSDLMLLGVTGYYGTRPSNSWIRLPVPTSSLRQASNATASVNQKANTITFPGNFNPRNPASVFAALPNNGTDTYGSYKEDQQIVGPTLIREDDRLATGPVIGAVEFGYELNAGADVESLATGPFITDLDLVSTVEVPAVAIAITALAPTVAATSPGTLVNVPAAVIALAGAAPSVAAGVVVSVPAAVVGLSGVVPTVTAGAVSTSYWSDWAAQNYGWDADLYPDWWAN